MEQQPISSRGANSSLPEWYPFPEGNAGVPGLQMIAPVKPGAYGQPSPAVRLMSNHGPALRPQAEVRTLLCWRSMGGGYPSDVAAVLGLLRIEQIESLLGGGLAAKTSGLIFWVPQSIARSWRLQEGNCREGRRRCQTRQCGYLWRCA